MDKTSYTIIQKHYQITDMMMLSIMTIGVTWLGKRAYLIVRTPIGLCDDLDRIDNNAPSQNDTF